VTTIPADLRAAVVQRAGNRCEHCLLSQDFQVATLPVDHVLPVVSGGRTHLESFALACPRCNSRKWVHFEATDPDSGLIVPLFNPRRQAWPGHFRWAAADPTVVEGLTPTGRAAMALLDLNGPQHLTIRRLLATLALHPPVD
jgi:hypothetical protein